MPPREVEQRKEMQCDRDEEASQVDVCIKLTHNGGIREDAGRLWALSLDCGGHVQPGGKSMQGDNY